ncbi:hypothetical protein [Spirilliplanes yamanashiensis]|uniref:Uncharacterized protein n=1 Tax=Spirilliplanes yamanashiensis TaxID=42233 RepID=A0A8J3Y312_9ACTN|nr:hypothetical protein [Spirilliplanes yamanashiensis]MDP9814279.1 hypothetical protein [Spirilliplanes yamanashiensis]GIJ00738.1 hypothetical protein Sya03_00900 [Spirilliplanes yamanashiensis]
MEWTTPGCALSRHPHTEAGMPVTPPDLAAVIAAIDEAGGRDFAAAYAGVEVDQAGVRAIVHRVPAADFDAAVRGLTPAGVCVVVRDAAHSRATLAALQERITADLAEWEGRGVRIETVGARHDGSGVEVGARDPERARAELAARYGADAPIVVVRSGPVVPLPG